MGTMFSIEPSYFFLECQGVSKQGAEMDGKRLN